MQDWNLIPGKWSWSYAPNPAQAYLDESNLHVSRGKCQNFLRERYSWLRKVLFDDAHLDFQDMWRNRLTTPLRRSADSGQSRSNSKKVMPIDSPDQILRYLAVFLSPLITVQVLIGGGRAVRHRSMPTQTQKKWMLQQQDRPKQESFRPFLRHDTGSNAVISMRGQSSSYTATTTKQIILTAYNVTK
jgi:hypothetical protein